TTGILGHLSGTERRAAGPPVVLRLGCCGDRDGYAQSATVAARLLLRRRPRRGLDLRRSLAARAVLARPPLHMVPLLHATQGNGGALRGRRQRRAEPEPLHPAGAARAPADRS